MRSMPMWVVMLSLLGLGCGEPAKSPNFEAKKDMPPTKDKAKGDQANAGKPAGAVEKEAEAPRKIIYTARLDLVVEDLGIAVDAMEKALEANKGYLAKSDERDAPRMPRSGTWVLRVPVANFSALRKKLLELGEVHRNALESQDVTDQFYDLQARLKSNQVKEEGLRKTYLEHSSKGAKLNELMAVEDRLTAVRSDIEVQQGQLNRWDKETQFATINLSMEDRKDYVAPTDPSFGTTIGRTYSGSIDALAAFGRGLVLTVVAVFPWLLVFGLIGGLVWIGIRRRIIRKKP
jgi:Domain of unknown function (DUF4349)